jgi:hypothetical protein
MSNNTSLTRDIGSGVSLVTFGDYELKIDTTSGIAQIILPSVKEWLNVKINVGNIFDLQSLRFSDVGGNSATNNITFIASVGDNIGGSSSLVINKNGSSGILIPSPDGISWIYLSSSVASAPVVSTTYSALLTSITNGTLIAGTYYLITNFRTVYDQPDFDSSGTPKPTVVTEKGSLEPILVVAISSTEISNNALSTIYPNDVIKYDYTFTHTEVMNAPAFGRITERIDNNYNRTDYDHRAVQFIRYESAPSSGIYNSYKDNGNPSQQFYTFNNNSTTSINNYIGNYAMYFNITFEPFLLSNNVLLGSADSNSMGNYSFNNTFGTGFSFNKIANQSFGNTVGNNFSYNNIANQFIYNVIGDDFSYNTINSTLFFLNTIGGNFQYNTISGVTFRFNTIGFNFALNSIESVFEYNHTGTIFEYNLIQSQFTHNTLGNDFENNVIGSYFEHNTTGIGFKQNNICSFVYSNTIGDYFQYNLINNRCNNNSIGSYCQHNQFFNLFGILGNIVGDNFRYNAINADVDSVDFTGATFVYTAYNKQIFSRQDGTLRLLYYNNSDASVIVNVTA